MALLPLASTSVTVRREMVVFNNQTISRIEGAVNHVTQRLTDSVIAWLALQLSKQKRTDFKPRNDDLSFARDNTEPCMACCEALEKVRNVAKENLSGKNLEVFLTEIGAAFHGLLLEHLRKFPVSATGGLMLAKYVYLPTPSLHSSQAARRDIKSYQDSISSFGIPSLHERFEFIRQLGQVFLVRPEILKSYITEGYLGRIDSALLRPYLAQRSDWGQAEKGFNDASNDAEEEGEGKGLGSRLGRLSVYMKDLELRDRIPPMTMPSLPTGISMPTLSVPSRGFGAGH
ncbi:hypothetical protein EIP86_009558 [Pleurotus ostreatoroseus]|nr:hypothetical protein EIP86_009558 [Pleurotus ostreatoroseus]